MATVDYTLKSAGEREREGRRAAGA